ncbi:phage portal protein [Gottschalkiaceae bacterium SANA]|nr:phage portal protein [Gottschalkiaceae bacterium SANA]
MGFFGKLVERRGDSIANPSNSTVSFLTGGIQSYTGKVVTEGNALTYSGVLACVNVISDTIASLPLFLYEKNQDTRTKARDHPLYGLLHDQPNPEMTSTSFRSMMQAHLLLWGNAYAEIQWGNDGYPKALWPLNPATTNLEREQGTRKLRYRVSLPNGKQVILPASNVLHLVGLTLDGVQGISPIGLAREAIGLGLSAEEFGSRFFGNNATPGGVLEHPKVLGKDAQSNLKESWNEMHQGLENSHRIAILEEGLTYKQIGIPQKDAQFLETRKFQLEEIARIYRVPQHLIGVLDKATFSNIEHQDISFVKHTIRPWLVRWEQSMVRSLLTSIERKRYSIEYNVDGLLRGDINTRYKGYHFAINDGWMSGNDVRKLENMELKDGLDEYFINGNMRPVKEILQGGEKSE